MLTSRGYIDGIHGAPYIAYMDPMGTNMDWRLSMAIPRFSGYGIQPWWSYPVSLGKNMTRGRAKRWSFNWVYHIGFCEKKWTNLKRTHGKLLKEIGTLKHRIFGFPNFFTQIWSWLRLLTTQISNCGMVLIASHPKKSFMARFQFTDITALAG